MFRRILPWGLLAALAAATVPGIAAPAEAAVPLSRQPFVVVGTVQSLSDDGYLFLNPIETASPNMARMYETTGRVKVDVRDAETRAGTPENWNHRAYCFGGRDTLFGDPIPGDTNVCPVGAEVDVHGYVEDRQPFKNGFVATLVRPRSGYGISQRVTSTVAYAGPLATVGTVVDGPLAGGKVRLSAVDCTNGFDLNWRVTTVRGSIFGTAGAFHDPFAFGSLESPEEWEGTITSGTGIFAGVSGASAILAHTHPCGFEPSYQLELEFRPPVPL